jgi:hypothetical protein
VTRQLVVSVAVDEDDGDLLDVFVVEVAESGSAMTDAHIALVLAASEATYGLVVTGLSGAVRRQ